MTPIYDQAPAQQAIDSASFELAAMTPADSPPPVQVSGCGDSLAERAAQKAREAFPNPPADPIENARRGAFLHEHRWELFDPDNTGYMNFSQFASYNWAFFLAYLPPGKCTIDLHDYMLIFGGPESNLEISRKQRSYLITAFTNAFNTLDHGKKGYITKSDLMQTFKTEFDRADKNRDGRLDHNEFQS